MSNIYHAPNFMNFHFFLFSLNVFLIYSFRLTRVKLGVAVETRFVPSPALAAYNPSFLATK